MKEVNQQFGITIVIVTHEMNVVNAICQRVTVMERGQIVEAFDPGDTSHVPRSAIAQFLARHDIALDKSEEVSLTPALRGADRLAREALSVG